MASPRNDAGRDPQPNWRPQGLPPGPDGRALPQLDYQARVESRREGAFTDEYLFGPDNYIKVAIRRDWGSSIVFYGLVGPGPGMNNSNTIDANDTGREIQIALYDPDRIHQGCAHNASCRNNPALRCPPSIRYLGWNPVQGGNRCNEGSGTDAIEAVDGALIATVRPLHWNPDWAAQNCEQDSCGGPNGQLRSEIVYRQSLRFVTDHIIEMEMRIHNQSDISHAEYGHEFPTLYATFGARNTQNLRRLFNSEGDEITIDQPANDGFFNRTFQSPAGWASLQNEGLGYGVGLFYENGHDEFQGWQRAGTFNNFRAPMPFAIPARSIIQARAYLLLGSYDTIRTQAQWLDENLAPFGSLDQAVLTGTLAVHGWVLDNHAVETVEVLVDGFPIGTLSVDGERDDVCIRWPRYRACPNVGFEGTLGWPAQANGQHVVDIRATDSHGNTRIIGRRTVFH